jgi:hypothetical protein
MSARMKLVTSKPDTRADLRAAHERRAAILAETRAAADLERNIRDALLAAMAALEELGDVDGEILKYRAASITSAAQGKMGSANTELPVHLEKRRAARAAALEQQAAAKLAHDQAHAALTEAEKAVQRADLAIADTATQVVFNEQAVKLADELRAAWSTIWKTADLLQALGATWTAGSAGPKAMRLPGSAVLLVQLLGAIDHRQFDSHGNGAQTAAAAHWKQWLNALREDADAPAPDFADVHSSVLERLERVV